MSQPIHADYDDNPVGSGLQGVRIQSSSEGEKSEEKEGRFHQGVDYSGGLEGVVTTPKSPTSLKISHNRNILRAAF
jgi:hypothetical protein